MIEKSCKITVFKTYFLSPFIAKNEYLFKGVSRQMITMLMTIYFKTELSPIDICYRMTIVSFILIVTAPRFAFDSTVVPSPAQGH